MNLALTARIRAHTSLPISYMRGALELPPSVSHGARQERWYAPWRRYFEANNLDGDALLYYTYRAVCLQKHRPLFNQRHLRYDITVIRAASVGKEPNRTIGHIHRPSKKERPAEIYEIISGHALFIFQDIHTSTYYILQAKTGDIIPIPGNWGHISVNLSARNPLIMSNIFWTGAPASDYGFFENTSGPAWYPHGHGRAISFHKNHHQKKIYRHVALATPILPRGMVRHTPLYQQFIRHPDAFSFLIPGTSSVSMHPADLYHI